jgi:hypothetical protein
MMKQYLTSKTNRSSSHSTKTEQVWDRSNQRHARSCHNLLELVLFLLISISAYSLRDFNLFEASSESVRQVLGYPPSATLINVALAVYCFSATILILTSIANDVRPTTNWNQLGYRSAFYFFYSFSGAISGNFIPVFLVGLCLYGLDQCHIWVYNCKTVQEQKELLGGRF